MISWPQGDAILLHFFIQLTLQLIVNREKMFECMMNNGTGHNFQIKLREGTVLTSGGSNYGSACYGSAAESAQTI